MRTKIKLVTLVSLFMLLGFSTAFGQGWEFDCFGDNFFSWQSQLSDSAGNPLAAGDYSLQYCFYEDSAATISIGCCSITITIPAAKFLVSGAAVSSRIVSTSFAYPVPILEDVVKRRGMAALAFPEIWLEITLQGETLEPTIKIYSVPFAGVAQRLNGDIVTQPGKITVLSPTPADSARIVLSADSTGTSIELYNSAGELRISMTSEDSTVTFRVPVVINGDLTVSGNVGIGTTNPTQKLQVAGTVYSTSGGFKFPDGSLQATASTGDITAVTAGSGLSGGGASGAVTLNIATGGVTSTHIQSGTILNSDINNAANIAPTKISGTAATLSGSNTFTGGGNTFTNGLTVGTIGDLVLHDNDLAFRRAGTHRWRLNEGSTTGFQIYQVYNDAGVLQNTTRLEIGDNGNIGIGATPSSNYKVYINPSYNTSSFRYGLYSNLINSSTGALYGVYGYVRHTTDGSGGTAVGVNGFAQSDGSSRYGLYGYAQAEDFSITTGSSYGVYARAYDGATAYGIYARGTSATTNYAGYFSGNVTVTGTLSKGGGSFQIDHPLDPENKYLFHSFVESPDMMNVYNGNVALDGNGEAVVTLPDYFEPLNKDFRYQLTAIGVPGPSLYIAEEISNNRFTIAGGEPGGKVSWQVTGIRQDKWAEANRIQVEVDKPDYERGLYIHPEAFGLGEEKFIHYEQIKEAEIERAERSGR